MHADRQSPAAASNQNVDSHRVRTLLILSTLMAFASISTDLYLPALPAMADALHSDPGTLQLTISGYLIGFSLGQLLWGPISDRHGRRLPVAIGLVLFIVGSAGCAMSGDAWTLIGWRALQAVGACASVVISRAMVRDLYSGVRAAQMMSTLMTVMAVAPLIGPSVGGLILHVASWRAIFWVLVAIGIATLAGLYCLPETLSEERRLRAPLGHSLAGYAFLLRNRSVLGYSASVGCFYGGIFPMSRAHRSPISATTGCRRNTMACCLPQESSAS
jgi:DHA1 family bicyclomycin/chloramphenicol resistance-like MFS transporter